ncbi:cell wall-binding repeat-containing protein [Kineococcus sp. LSe6-4]|uniref:Cell wall-binding repeat-containing protein n=1 Tax=Kineococcus halophytocola TaxID=3234027 RepID=A0ABV4GVF1_9ACTN
MRLLSRPLRFSVAAATAAAAVVVCSTSPALAATTVTRVYGADRVATAVATAAAFTGRKAQAVVLTRSDTYADALAGAPLAADKSGPLLLTSTASLDPAVAVSLQDVLPTGGTVYLLGDTNALSSDVETAVHELGFETVRLAGADRYATAVAIAEAMPQADTVSVVTGQNFPDGLAAGAFMGVQDPDTTHALGVVLLSDGTKLGTATSAYLGSRTFEVKYAVGGAAVSAVTTGASGTWDDLAGADRYATAALVAQQFTSTGAFSDATTAVGVATGENWPDAMAGSALLAFEGGPMLLTRKDTLPTSTAQVLTALTEDATTAGTPISHALVFGSADAVSDAVYTQITAALQ